MPLSQKQMEYLAIAWQCFDVEPKVDYDKFHKLANLASANSARELLRVTKNKLREEYGPAGTGAGVTKTPGSRKRGTPASGSGATGSGKGKEKGGKKGAKGEKDSDEEDVVSDDEEVEDGDGSPRKKAKKGGKGAGVVVKEEPEEDGEGGFDEVGQFM